MEWIEGKREVSVSEVEEYGVVPPIRGNVLEYSVDALAVDIEEDGAFIVEYVVDCPAFECSDLP